MAKTMPKPEKSKTAAERKPAATKRSAPAKAGTPEHTGTEDDVTITAHGNGVRQLGTPVLGEMMVQNYRAARLSKRQRAMLDFAVKLTVTPWEVVEEDRERLRRAGFTDRDIWDIASVAAFYNMTNRLASATDMRPNSVYHGQAR